jgi:hypothetical protein
MADNNARPIILGREAPTMRLCEFMLLKTTGSTDELVRYHQSGENAPAYTIDER